MSMTESKLEKQIKEFKETSEDQDFIEFKAVVSLFDSIEQYIREKDMNNFDEDEIQKFVDKAEAMYKVKAKELSGKDLEKFRDYMNLVIFALNFLPLDEKGNEISADEFDEWESEVYQKYRS